MTVLTEAIQSCADKSLFGPPEIVINGLKSLLEGRIALTEYIYAINMVDSRNLGWIDCIRIAMESVNA